jgi:hypothetical protein
MDLCCGPSGASGNKKLEDSVVIMDGDGADAARALVAARSKAPDFSVNPVYEDIMSHIDDYVRIHVHLVGLVSTEGHTGAIGKRRNRFGRPRLVDTIADPYVIVEVIGATESEGSPKYFPIASHTFPTIQDCQTPVWDSKCVLLVKKATLASAEGGGGGGGIRFTLLDENATREDEVLFTLEVKADDLPEPTPVLDSSWKHYCMGEKGKDDDDSSPSRIQNTAMEFSLMVTEGSDRLVSEQDMEAIYSGGESNEGYEYSEIVLVDEDEEVLGDRHAVLQCWTHADSTKAVLWILGRNDCFMHPHVAKALFWSQGYDLYVLNYKMNGCCRKHGFVQDPHFVSHNPSGNFNTYISNIEQSLERINGNDKDYELLMGYAHSTGGPVLLNYLMEKGDDAFDGFLFNSPFLDWGFVGGDLVELVLENTGIFEKLGAMTPDSKVGTAGTPEGTTPLMYLGKEIVLSDWSARLWSLYYFDWATRPIYKVPMTVGFAKGVTDVHRKMKEDFKDKKRPITAKPFLCITSRGDDVLKAPETLGRADWIGPGRWEIELNDNGHDIFLSYDASDTEMAIQMCLTWMKNRKFI